MCIIHIKSLEHMAQGMKVYVNQTIKDRLFTYSGLAIILCGVQRIRVHSFQYYTTRVIIMSDNTVLVKYSGRRVTSIPLEKAGNKMLRAILDELDW